MISNYFNVMDDPYNRMKKRNIHNTSRYEYNCGGYAFNIMNWYVPIDCFSYCYDDIEEAYSKLDELAEAMIEEIDGLRVIEDISELHEDEYAVAFRFTSSMEDYDFHFIKRGRNGHWYEKMGSSRGINRVPAWKVFSPVWKYRNVMKTTCYDSPILLFAKKF